MEGGSRRSSDTHAFGEVGRDRDHFSAVAKEVGRGGKGDVLLHKGLA